MIAKELREWADTCALAPLDAEEVAHMIRTAADALEHQERTVMVQASAYTALRAELDRAERRLDAALGLTRR